MHNSVFIPTLLQFYFSSVAFMLSVGYSFLVCNSIQRSLIQTYFGKTVKYK